MSSICSETSNKIHPKNSNPQNPKNPLKRKNSEGYLDSILIDSNLHSDYFDSVDPEESSSPPIFTEEEDFDSPKARLTRKKNQIQGKKIDENKPFKIDVLRRQNSNSSSSSHDMGQFIGLGELSIKVEKLRKLKKKMLKFKENEINYHQRKKENLKDHEEKKNEKIQREKIIHQISFKKRSDSSAKQFQGDITNFEKFEEIVKQSSKKKAKTLNEMNSNEIEKSDVDTFLFDLDGELKEVDSQITKFMNVLTSESKKRHPKKRKNSKKRKAKTPNQKRKRNRQKNFRTENFKGVKKDQNHDVYDYFKGTYTTNFIERSKKKSAKKSSRKHSPIRLSPHRKLSDHTVEFLASSAKKIENLDGNNGIGFFPFLWNEYNDINELTRKPISIAEIWSLQLDLKRQL